MVIRNKYPYEKEKKEGITDFFKRMKVKYPKNVLEIVQEKMKVNTGICTLKQEEGGSYRPTKDRNFMHSV